MMPHWWIAAAFAASVLTLLCVAVLGLYVGHALEQLRAMREDLQLQSRLWDVMGDEQRRAFYTLTHRDEREKAA